MNGNIEVRSPKESGNVMLASYQPVMLSIMRLRTSPKILCGTYVQVPVVLLMSEMCYLYYANKEDKTYILLNTSWNSTL